MYKENKEVESALYQLGRAGEIERWGTEFSEMSDGLIEAFKKNYPLDKKSYLSVEQMIRIAKDEFPGLTERDVEVDRQYILPDGRILMIIPKDHLELPKEKGIFAVNGWIPKISTDGGYYLLYIFSHRSECPDIFKEIVERHLPKWIKVSSEDMVGFPPEEDQKIFLYKFSYKLVSEIKDWISEQIRFKEQDISELKKTLGEKEKELRIIKEKYT